MELVQLGTFQKPRRGRGFRPTRSGLGLDTRAQGEGEMPSSGPGKVGKATEVAVCTGGQGSQAMRGRGRRRGLGAREAPCVRGQADGSCKP